MEKEMEKPECPYGLEFGGPYTDECEGCELSDECEEEYQKRREEKED